MKRIIDLFAIPTIIIVLVSYIYFYVLNWHSFDEIFLFTGITAVGLFEYNRRQ